MKKTIYTYKGKTGLVETLTHTATFKIYISQADLSWGQYGRGIRYTQSDAGEFEGFDLNWDELDRGYASVGRAMTAIRRHFKSWYGDTSTNTLVIYPLTDKDGTQLIEKVGKWSGHPAFRVGIKLST
jgi:hypothetical protein